MTDHDALLAAICNEPDEDTLAMEAFGLTAIADFVDAGTQSPAYCTGSHALQTSLPPQEPGKFHLSIAQDAQMPIDGDGVPVLAEDYFYMMTAE